MSKTPTPADEEARAVNAASLRYLVHLIACALAGTEPLPLPAPATWEKVYAIAHASTIEGMSWRSARARAAEMPAELARAWAAESDATLWRRVQFDMAREQVLAALSEAGLSYVPLKGVVIAPLYPDPSMRSMCDNDILYARIEPAPGGGYRICGDTPDEQEKTVERSTDEAVVLMRRLGYEPDCLGKGNADSFKALPCLNFELHRVLLTAADFGTPGPLVDPWARAIADAESDPAADPHAFHFDEETFYLHFIAHAAKHHTHGGTGLRTLVDAYVVSAALEGALAAEPVAGRLAADLAEMQLTDFERELREGARDAFGPVSCENAQPQFSSVASSLLGIMSSAGTYGNMDRRVENDLARFRGESAQPLLLTKARFTIRRLLLSPEQRLEFYPTLGRYKVLFPVYLAHRLCRMVVRFPRALADLRRIHRFEG